VQRCKGTLAFFPAHFLEVRLTILVGQSLTRAKASMASDEHDLIAPESPEEDAQAVTVGVDVKCPGDLAGQLQWASMSSARVTSLGSYSGRRCQVPG